MELSDSFNCTNIYQTNFFEHEQKENKRIKLNNCPVVEQETVPSVSLSLSLNKWGPLLNTGQIVQ